jgi:hypothetical protein
MPMPGAGGIVSVGTLSKDSTDAQNFLRCQVFWGRGEALTNLHKRPQPWGLGVAGGGEGRGRLLCGKVMLF